MRQVWKILVAIIILGLTSLGASYLMGNRCSVPPYVTAKAEDVIVIKSILASQEAAWNSGDIEGFMQVYLQSDS